MGHFKLAQIQMPVFDHVMDSWDYAEGRIRRAAAMGADFIALPEMFACPYVTEKFPDYAQEEGGPLWQLAGGLARSLGVYLSAGTMPERTPQGKIYNTAYVFGRDGRQLAKHRKVHLFDIDIRGGQSFKESDTLSAGDTFTVFDTEFGCFGLCVCYDFRFPELTRAMALSGAVCVFVPASFNLTTGPAHWELTFRAQAVFNQVFTVGTATARQPYAPYQSWGHSLVCDPWGDLLGSLDEKPGVLMTEIDLGRVEEVRAGLPLLKQRRPQAYLM